MQLLLNTFTITLSTPVIILKKSSGPNSDFKNKNMVSLCSMLSSKYGRPSCWKFTATSHGKVVVDGVGVE